MHSTLQPSFSELIAPLTPADIAALWRERAFKFQPRRDDKPFTALLDWNALWGLIEEDSVPLDKCRVTYGRRPVPPLFFSEVGKIKPDKLARLCDQGTSILLSRLEEYVPVISAVRRNAAEDGVAVSHVTVIVTTGGDGALQEHYDLSDLVVLQVEGTKRWQIFSPRDPNPVKPSATKIPPQTPPLHDIVLRPGDILFVPAGTWHVCDNGPDRSLHLALLLKPPPDGKERQ